MKLIFTLILVVHGLIHLLGMAKAFGIAALPLLTQPISRPLGALWLVAAVLFITAAIALFAWPRMWWVVGAAAVVVSQVVILTSWSDARHGTIANVLVLVVVVLAWLAQAPGSYRAQYCPRRGAGSGPGRRDAVAHRGRPGAVARRRSALCPAFGS
jgi:hypothetical protein